MRAGTRASAAPFAQKTAAGTFEGFSVDLLHEFREAAEKTGGIANVGVVLLGLAARAGQRRSVVPIPRAAFLAAEFRACVLPQDDSPWRDFINRNLVGMFAHGGGSGGRYLEIYDRWFGRDSAVFYPLDQSSRDYLRNVSIWTYREWQTGRMTAGPSACSSS